MWCAWIKVFYLQYEAIVQEKNEAEMDYLENVRQLESKHQNKIQDLERKYQQKIVEEVERLVAMPLCTIPYLYLT